MQGEDGTHEVKSYPRADSLIGWIGEAMWGLAGRQSCRLVGSVVVVYCTAVPAELSIPSFNFRHLAAHFSFIISSSSSTRCISHKPATHFCTSDSDFGSGQVSRPSKIRKATAQPHSYFGRS